MATRVEISNLARIVLVIDSVRHFALGGALFFAPHLFDIPPYDATAYIAPFHAWGAMFMAVGFYCACAVFRQGPMRVHHAFQASAIVSVLWSAVFIAALITGTADAVRLLIPNLALLAIDLTFVSISVQKKGPVNRE